MNYFFGFVLYKQYAYNVETDGIAWVFTKVCCYSAFEKLSFFCGHKFLGIAEIITGARLYLYEDCCVALLHYQIQFPLAMPPISI